MTRETTIRRVAQLEAKASDAGANIALLVPPGTLSDDEYQAWRDVEVAKLPAGTKYAAIRFVAPNHDEGSTL